MGWGDRADGRDGRARSGNFLAGDADLYKLSWKVHLAPERVQIGLKWFLQNFQMVWNGLKWSRMPVNTSGIPRMLDDAISENPKPETCQSFEKTVLFK